MRSAVALAAFAAGALAVPYGHRHHNREIHTDYDIVIKTDVVYVTAGEPAATAAAAPVVTTTADLTTAVAPTSTPVSLSEHQKWGGAQPEKPSPAAPSVVMITTVLGPQAPSSTFVAPPAPAPSSESAAEAPSSPAAAPAPAPQTSTPESSNTGNLAPASTSYQDIVVFHHNIHRRNHSSPDIQWSDDLAASAAVLASTCDFNHNTVINGGGYGQNLCAGYDAANISAVVTESWYNGEVGWYTSLYGVAQPDTSETSNFKDWGHFSQLVWASTSHVGCATHDCSAVGLANTDSGIAPFFTVCNYGAPGNMANGYAANINRPLGEPTASWSEGL